jgi:PAS domain-containing protein
MPASLITAALEEWRAAERRLTDLPADAPRLEAELEVICRWLEYQAASGAPGVIIVADADRRFVATSPGAEALFGRSIIGLRGEDVTAPLRAPKASDRYQRFRQRGMMRGVFPIVRPSGEVVWVVYQAQADVPVVGYSSSRLRLARRGAPPTAG